MDDNLFSKQMFSAAWLRSMNHTSKIISNLILVLASPIFEVLMIASVPMYIQIYVYNVGGITF